MSIGRAIARSIIDGNNVVIKVKRVSGKYNRRIIEGSSGLSIYLPLGEQDYRPTKVDPTKPKCPAEPERQLNYYTASHLTFVSNYPKWSELLNRIENNVPTRRAPYPPGCEVNLAAITVDEVVIDGRQFNSPMPLMRSELKIYLPAIMQ